MKIRFDFDEISVEAIYNNNYYYYDKRLFEQAPFSYGLI